ncbi:MAG: helix-turn-helix transcriptional regulator [Alphaproteobacteria bacterium]|jgi:DNA-binding HxlR family transcriptional regulator|nr:helix-turn-helix transcriptional regulator [Alphaproteobacteria bacterium]MBU1549434.1 helix-turn-helix transcriptional regulator [Alphaproteobacteria bacterium]MBU2338199.1 helix-turn-helix transcriptional regulator [Alphaproteobacteria bacterium]MBU2387586.1 helix-turn-helix transcriptional regulator [Alphaproteobacteria bacterium]
MKNQTTSGVVPGSADPSHEDIRRVLTAITGKWKLEILWQLNQSPHRFNELRRAVPGITQNMLTEQLRELEADGLVAREVFAEVPVRVEYSLTQKSRSLAPVMDSLIQWWRSHSRR